MNRAESVGWLLLRVEFLLGLLAVSLFAALSPWNVLEWRPLVFGVLFAGVNFLLLAYGVRWGFTPLSSRGRRRTGVVLLVLKLALFLGVLALLLLRFDIEPLSLAAGVSCLLTAIVVERLWVILGG